MTTVPTTLEVKAGEWRTPLTGIEAAHGRARLKPSTYRKGYYRMEGIGGHEFYRITGPGRMPVALLQRVERYDPAHPWDNPPLKWKTWMVDDPLHWLGMRERVMALPPGKLLVAGLGLGLFAHHLLERPDIDRIEVVEIDPDVIALIEPTLPDDPRRTIVQADYYQHIRTLEERPDAVLWDLAVGEVGDTRSDFYRALAETAIALPNVPLSCFGLRDGAGTILG